MNEFVKENKKEIVTLTAVYIAAVGLVKAATKLTINVNIRLI